MNRGALRSLAHAKLGFAALVTAGAVAGQSLSADIGLQVNLVTSSGTCEADPALLQATCHAPTPAEPEEERESAFPGGPLLPEAGAVPYQRAGTIRALRVGAATQPAAAQGDGTKVTSWRVVELDNGRYIELTIAW